MTFRYQVFFSHADSGRSADHTQVATDSQLNTPEGRREAEQVLAARGIRNPKIHAYGLLDRADQGKQS